MDATLSIVLHCCYAFSMQITVDIPDDFAAQAKARGLTPEDYVRSLVESAVHSDPARTSPRHSQREMDDFFRGMAQYSDKIPALPDEAYTRESFYRDRD